MRTLSVASPNHIARTVYKSTSELGTPLYTGQPVGPNGVHYREVPLNSARSDHRLSIDVYMTRRRMQAVAWGISAAKEEVVS